MPITFKVTITNLESNSNNNNWTKQQIFH